MKFTHEQIEDRLVEALLRQQSSTTEKQELQNIETALDAEPPSVAFFASSSWRTRLGIIAACVMVGLLAVGIDSGLKSQRASKKIADAEAALVQAEQAKKDRSAELAAIDKAIRDQADKVEERRKVLATIVRNKGIIYKGKDTYYTQAEDQSAGNALTRSGPYEEAIRRGLDAQDYVDAKRDFESDQELLQEMRLKQINLGIQERFSKHDQVSAEQTGDPSTELAMNGKPTVVAPSSNLPGQPSVKKRAVEDKPVLHGGIDIIGGSAFTMRKPAPAEPTNSERYNPLVDPSWKRSTDYPLSTFSIDVDNASYSNIRRFIRDGQNIPADSVRIEECINAFDYNYPQPVDDKAFSVNTTLATCPWNEDHLLVKVGIKGREISKEQRPVSNLVFLIDVSGSMQSADKLPLVKESLKLLVHQLDERDSVSYVVYAGSQGVVLPPTKLTESGRANALEALGKLEAGGSTNGGAGILRAYQIAKEMFIKGGVNRVILATDGDFNVGITDQSQLVSLVKERAADNIYLSVLGFGKGNLNDSLMESISKDGNGNHYYIDSIREGRKVLLQRLSGTLITIAKDVKIQIEFNPRKVGSYRLIGYANRQLRDEDFNNDKVDAGDIGAGHTVTAFYEIVPADMVQQNGGGVDALKYQQSAEKPVATNAEPSNEWLTLKVRHKSPEGDISSLQESVVEGPAARWQDADSDFSFASAVALFGMKLRGMDEAKFITWPQVRELATPGLKHDLHEDRTEFIGLLEALEKRGN